MVASRNGRLLFYIIPIDSNEAHLPTPRYGQYLTHAHNHITRAVAATARVIWLCACVRYWPYRGVGKCASLLSIGIVILYLCMFFIANSINSLNVCFPRGLL